MAIRPVQITSTAAKFTSTLSIGPHTLSADEPVAEGGNDAGPNPFELLGAALSACTTMTLKGYAERKAWPLERVEVTVAQTRGAEQHTFQRTIRLFGPLDAEQKQRLLEIAGRCPVHKVLTGKIAIESALA